MKAYSYSLFDVVIGCLNVRRCTCRNVCGASEVYEWHPTLSSLAEVL